jgi:hypothetical protein
MTVAADRIERALLKVAKMLEVDSGVAPVFERLEAELADARARERGETDVQRRARALLAQRARPASKSRTWASDAPAP